MENQCCRLVQARGTDGAQQAARANFGIICAHSGHLGSIPSRVIAVLQALEGIAGHF